MYRFLSDCARDDLHRSGNIITPPADIDSAHAAAPGWKERSVPCEEPLLRERLVMVTGCIHHHFNRAVNLTIGINKIADIKTQPPGNGGSDLIAVQYLAFDLAGFNDIFG